MLNTLRYRLILSHVLPLLVIIPVMGITLIYVLETQVLLSDLGRELMGHAALASDLVKTQPDVWQNPSQAAAFAAQVSQSLATRVVLIDARGQLLATSDAGEDEWMPAATDLTVPPGVLDGRVSMRTTYSRQLHAEIVDVWAPVKDPSEQVMGVIRLSHRLATVQEQFLRLRYLIVGVLVAGLLLGTAVGLLLALTMERPLQQVAEAIFGLAGGEPVATLPEQGPAEIRLQLRAVNTLRDRLYSLEQARRQLLANLVHELGRPLGALLSAIQALQGGANRDPALQAELLVGMKEEVKRLQRLLDDLARLHGQILGTLELGREPVVLQKWLAQVLPQWREAARTKGLHWEANLPANLPTVEIDSDRLARAFGNLLSNAVKYTPPGGTVAISAGVENGDVWLRVSDTGPGIEPEEQTRIFTPFYRGSAAGRFPQGMGLGLTIAQDLVTAHGGRLELDSKPGQGTRFTIRIPVSSS